MRTLFVGVVLLALVAAVGYLAYEGRQLRAQVAALEAEVAQLQDDAGQRRAARGGDAVAQLREELESLGIDAAFVDDVEQLQRCIGDLLDGPSLSLPDSCQAAG